MQYVQDSLPFSGKRVLQVVYLPETQATRNQVSLEMS
jgi:hypothetical protein